MTHLKLSGKYNKSLSIINLDIGLSLYNYPIDSLHYYVQYVILKVNLVRNIKYNI